MRLPVPRSLQKVLGRAERIKALGTFDRERAEQLALPILAEWRREEQAAPGNEASGSAQPTLQKPTNADIEAIAVKFGFDMPREYEDRRRTDLVGAGRGRLERFQQRLSENVAEFGRQAATGDLEAVKGLARLSAEASGFEVDPESEQFRRLCNFLAVSRHLAAKESQRRLMEDPEAEVSSELIKRVRKRDDLKAKAGQTIAELFEVYGKQLIAEKQKRQDGVDQDRMVVKRFAEFVGHDRAVGSIGYDEAKAFVDGIEHLPAGYSRMAKYRGLTIHEAIAKGQADGAKVLGQTTQARYISTVSPFFQWLSGERGGRRATSNPFNGLQRDLGRVKTTKARPPFGAGQIAAIINSPLFTGFLADGNESEPGNTHADDWRYWLPLFALFAGARVSEIAQLNIADITKIGGIWCFEFCEDERSGQQTKSRRNRTVAVHSTLIK